MVTPRTKTNNDKLMQKTGLLIVYAWVLLAVGFFVLTAWDPTYLDSSEDYVSILAIIGGPALLIVTKIIETWNQEKGAQLQDYEAQASHERDMDAIRVRHAADMERNPHVEAAVQAATDGVQDTRIGGLESMLADAITEIESLRTHVEDLDTSSRSRRRSD
jgi:hypothetical protein